MLCGETVAVCCENRTEHKDTLWAVRTSQETLRHRYSPQATNVVLGKQSLFSCEKRTEHTDTVCGQSVPHGKHVTFPLRSPTG
jgi:hypothetical protein